MQKFTAERFDRIMEENNVTREDIAVIMAAYQGWREKNADMDMQVGTLLAVANFLGCKAADFFEEAPE